MKQPYIIKIAHSNWLLEASCLAEARCKARKLNGRLIGQFDNEDYRLKKQIIESLK